MSGVTNDLIRKSQKLSRNFIASEYDVLVSSGEQITAGLLSMALNAKEIPSRSFMGWQIPVFTDNTFSKANIAEIRKDVLMQALNRNEIAVIPGFQGVTDENQITTLGRGGSDTSAVAIASALNAKRCDIYTDVDGIYTADPRMVPKAKKLDKISYEEMLVNGKSRSKSSSNSFCCFSNEP